MMIFAEAFTTAVQELRRYALRYCLVALSLLLGIASISGITTMSYLSREDLVAKSEQLTGRAPTYSVVGTSSVVASNPGRAGELLEARSTAGLTLSYEIGGSVEAIPATGWYPKSALPSPWSDPGVSARWESLNAMWYQGHPELLRRIVIIEGAWPDGPDTPALAANRSAADVLGTAGDEVLLTPPGRSRARRFVLAAVVDDGIADPMVYLNLGQRSALDLLEPGSQGVSLRVHDDAIDSSNLPGAANDLAFDLGLTYDQPPYRSDSVKEIEDAVAKTERRFLIAAILALLIASLGILNIGLATVNERWRELAIRSAFGAAAYRLFLPVVLSAILVAGAVWLITAIGVVVVVGYVGSTIPLGSPLEPPPVPIGPLALSLIAGMVTAIVGAALPAWRAARSDPADALRS